MNRRRKRNVSRAGSVPKRLVLRKLKGGWYQLSNGRKVQGSEAARAAAVACAN